MYWSPPDCTLSSLTPALTCLSDQDGWSDTGLLVSGRSKGLVPKQWSEPDLDTPVEGLSRFSEVWQDGQNFDRLCNSILRVIYSPS